MRNSFSLSVYFILGCKCDAKIIHKTSDTASGNMKLIPFILLVNIAVDVKCNELFTFPPRFHPPNSGVMLSSDSSIYLPPESQTAAPYYPMKNVNNLPFPYLPHTGSTKAPMLLPTSYPMTISSTLLPIHDDDNDNEDEKHSSFHIQKNNRTRRVTPENMEKNVRHKPINYQAIDRIDMKPPFRFINPPSFNNAPPQKATPRSMIVSVEQQRNDALDQIRSAATYQGPQHYLPAPNAPGVYISSTTETAVPILRLSNEMDLDGSFSYEALGADQTHYVQHSRVENGGTDKEEQVVEGSYSYVGDNGQTYTVHYVADSKGFRASGDHLPVPPPIPEIIQRAVQYNLAEEAKRPPNQKLWNEDKENELSESERYNRYVLPPTARPLFTGKTPESFSFGFAQEALNTHNLIPAASTQNPIRINNDFLQVQSKNNNNNVNNAETISPQITFLASQGAHLPSANNQPSISRVFTTERTTLPQIVNYEATLKENQAAEQSENNKGLWRWQYGLNANINHTPEKKTISRSSGVGDDVMINFGEMTSDQYTKMLKSQLEPDMDQIHDDQIAQPNEMMKIYKEPNHSTKVHDGVKPDSKVAMESTDSSYFSTQKPDWHKHLNPYDQNNQISENIRQNVENTSSSRSKLITHNNFVPQSQLITQSYDYDDISYEPKRISKYSSTVAPEVPYFNYNNMNNYEKAQHSFWPSSNQIENDQRVSSTEVPVTSNILHNTQFNGFIGKENTDDFKPILSTHIVDEQKELASTTKTIEDDMFESNMFLKNHFKTNKNMDNVIKEENKNYQTKEHTEHKYEKSPKLINMEAKAHNDITVMPKKPLDLIDIMNYLSAKNHFESVKVKSKPKYGTNNNNQRNEVRFIPVQHEQFSFNNNDDQEENTYQNVSNHRTSYYHPEEMRGIIKNYKVLQRNNSAFKNGQDVEQLRRDLSPPPVKILHTNLPPLGRAGPSTKSYLPPIYV